MAPRGFDRYMIVIGAGVHPKFGGLTDSERCAYFLGVLAVAATARPRGCLLAGAQPAGQREVARLAGVSEKVALTAIEKLIAVGVLEHDDERQCWRVHDWIDVNREPASSAERMARLRARRSASQAPSPGVTVTSQVTSQSVSEGEGKGEGKEQSQSQHLRRAGSSTVRELFDYWRAQCEHPNARLSADRRGKIQARLSEGYTEEQIRRAIDGAARRAFVNGDGRRFDDIELICRHGAKLESFIERESAPAKGVERVSAETQARLDERLEQLRAEADQTTIREEDANGQDTDR